MAQPVLYKPHMTRKKTALGFVKWLFLVIMIIFTMYPSDYLYHTWFPENQCGTDAGWKLFSNRMAF